MLIALLNYAAAAPWLLPSSEAQEAGHGEVGGGFMLFSYKRQLTEDVSALDLDPSAVLRGSYTPVKGLQLSAILGVGPQDVAVVPVLSLRYNFIERERVRLGVWIFGSWMHQGLDDAANIINYGTGFSMEMGGEHLRFDLSSPILGGEVGNRSMFEFGVVSPIVHLLPEAGIRGIYKEHSLRLGMFHTFVNMDYMYSRERWFVQVGGMVDIVHFTAQEYTMPTIGRVEAGWRF
jgi:hypothetical protein